MKLIQLRHICCTFLIIFCILLLPGCGENNAEPKIAGRWYNQSQINLGQELYEKHCKTCHGFNAEGTSQWKQKLPDGSYPPPPLNGTAHAWHHSMSALIRSIDNGGIPLGGKMPGFKGQFDDKEKFALISHFQNFWPDKTYEAWIQRGGLK
jgi:mono/diheme cytochrome c family protein